MSKQLIQLGHSPDSDDAFMFYGLATGAVDSGPFEFKHILQDIQTLNDWAGTGKLEVTAVSVHAYAYLQDSYAVLSSGASMGATELAQYVPDHDMAGKFPVMPKPSSGAHGPLLLAREPMSLDQASSLTIGVPGLLTSAFLGLRLAIGEFKYEVINFDDIVPAVIDGRIDAGLVIHEGQLTYKQDKMHCVIDLGQWWFDETQLPLPLGCNLIRRDLGMEKMQQISAILKESIHYSLTHRSEAVDYALQFGRGLDAKSADEFIAMYVNEWTLDYGPTGREALLEFLKRGNAAKITPAVDRIDFV